MLIYVYIGSIVTLLSLRKKKKILFYHYFIAVDRKWIRLQNVFYPTGLNFVVDQYELKVLTLPRWWSRSLTKQSLFFNFTLLAIITM